MENKPNQFTEKHNDSVNIHEILEKYTFHWKWFFLSAFILLSISFLYLRYTQKIYSSKGTILIKDAKKGGAMQDMAVFSDLGLFGSSGNLENEIEILKSRKLATVVAKILNLNKKYILRGTKTGFSSAELYQKSPIKLNHYINDSLLYNLNGQFELNIIDNNYFNLSEETGNKIEKIKFGDKVKTSIGLIKISKTDAFEEKFITNDFEIVILNLDDVISSLKKTVNISTINKNAFVLEISTKGPVIDKNNAIINELISNMELDQLKDQN